MKVASTTFHFDWREKLKSPTTTSNIAECPRQRSLEFHALILWEGGESGTLELPGVWIDRAHLIIQGIRALHPSLTPCSNLMKFLAGVFKRCRSIGMSKTHSSRYTRNVHFGMQKF